MIQRSEPFPGPQTAISRTRPRESNDCEVQPEEDQFDLRPDQNTSRTPPFPRLDQPADRCGLGPCPARIGLAIALGAILPGKAPLAGDKESVRICVKAPRGRARPRLDRFHAENRVWRTGRLVPPGLPEVQALLE